MNRVWLFLSVCMFTPVMADVPPAQTAATVATAPPASTTGPATQSSPTSAAPVMLVTPSCREIKAFKEKMHKAIDAALRYPAELSFLYSEGVTIIGYDYQEGKVSNVHITQPSNDGRLVRTALRAVENADYASITPGIGPIKMHDSVIIVFDNSANSEKNVAEQKVKENQEQETCD